MSAIRPASLTNAVRDLHQIQPKLLWVSNEHHNCRQQQVGLLGFLWHASGGNGNQSGSMKPKFKSKKTIIGMKWTAMNHNMNFAFWIFLIEEWFFPKINLSGPLEVFGITSTCAFFVIKWQHQLREMLQEVSVSAVPISAALKDTTKCQKSTSCQVVVIRKLHYGWAQRIRWLFLQSSNLRN